MDERWINALRLGLLGAVVGAGAGSTVGAFVFAIGRVNVFLIVVPVFAAVGGIGMFAWSAVFMHGAGAALQRLYLGGRLPAKRDFSEVDAQLVRGRYDLARSLLEDAAAQAPTDGEARLRLARLLRDRLDRPAEAAEWLREARRAEPQNREVELQATHELAELYLGALGQPAAAIPEFARLADRFGALPIAGWAERHLQRLRAEVRGPTDP
jgi:tetratricopeptide (TPR) repeat protein